MKVFLVGGAVRDELLGLPVKECDWVVVGATPAVMLKQGFISVGKDFPVFLHPKTKEEYALARAERKVAPGYHGFEFEADQKITLEEDLLRRDLSVNAMARDEQGNIIDPYGGKADLEKKVLRHVSLAFKEDPVRVLRVARFYARYKIYGFYIHQSTLDLMQAMSHNGEISALVAERVWRELVSALAEPKPMAFFEALHKVDALEILAPPLNTLFIRSSKELSKALDGAVEKHLSAELVFSILASWAAQADVSLLAWCKQIKAPLAYQKLATLLESVHSLFKESEPLKAEVLWEFFKCNDLMRNPQRFYQIESAWAFYAMASSQEEYQQVAAALKAILAVVVSKHLKKGDKPEQIKRTVKSLQIKAVRHAIENGSNH